MVFKLLHTLLIANMAKSAGMDDHHLGYTTKLEKKLKDVEI
jgi:hypothetical protein